MFIKLSFVMLNSCEKQNILQTPAIFNIRINFNFLMPFLIKLCLALYEIKVTPTLLVQNFFIFKNLHKQLKSYELFDNIITLSLNYNIIF